MGNGAMTNESNVLKPLRTWSHLAGAKRKPSEYEVVSVNTLYNVDDAQRPLELDSQVFMNKWLRKYRHESPLRHANWGGFRDPDEMIYRTYTTMQDGQETYVDGLLDEHDELGHDSGLSPAWLATLASHYTPARYLLHALQMASAYVVVMAPSSTIANCAAMQAADQLRWLGRVAYRTAELAKNRPNFGFGKRERQLWEGEPAWQGMRELIERTLTAYDWGESFVALNLVGKIAIDEGVLRPLAVAARRNGDTLLAFLVDAQLRDSERSRRWSGVLVQYALAGEESNKAVIDGWVEKWMPLAERAVDEFCAGLPDAEGEAVSAKRRLHQVCANLRNGG